MIKVRIDNPDNELYFEQDFVDCVLKSGGFEGIEFYDDYVEFKDSNDRIYIYRITEVTDYTIECVYDAFATHVVRVYTPSQHADIVTESD